MLVGWHASSGYQVPTITEVFLPFLCFVCWFLDVKPENPYFASPHEFGVNPLGIYPLG